MGNFKFGGVTTQEAVQQACEKLVREHGIQVERLKAENRSLSKKIEELRKIFNAT